MDPLSITVAVGGVCQLAYSLAESLQSGIKKAKDVDITLQAFAKEISVLGDTLKLIQDGLQHPNLTNLALQAPNANANLANILGGLEKILEDCKDTLGKLEEIIKENTSTLSSRVFRRSVTAFKLNSKSADIARIRQQIGGYTNAMHMTLSMLNISLVLGQTQPTVITQLELRNRITSLEESRDALQESVEAFQKLKISDYSNQKANNLNQYVQNSGSVLSAASIYMGSIDGSILDNADIIEDTEGSVVGLDPEKRLAIESWRTKRGNDIYDQSSFSAKLDTRRFDLAVKKFNQEEYTEAGRLLLIFIKNCRGSGGSSRYQVFDGQVLLAQTYRKQKRLQDVIDLFHQMLSSGDMSTTQRSLIKHHLADTYFADSRATHALPWAIAACEEHHEHQNKDLHFESCILAAKILQDLGETTEAELLLEDLPLISRSRLMFPASPVTVALKSLKSIRGHADFVRSISVSPDGCTFASGADDHLTKLWSLPVGKLKMTLTGHTTFVKSVAFSSDGQTILSVSFNETIRLWNATSGTALEIPGNPDRGEVMAISTDGDKIALCGAGNRSAPEYSNVRLWHCTTGELLKTLTGHSDGVTAVAFSPDNHTIASASIDGVIKLWEVISGNLLITLAGHTNVITSLVFSTNGSLIASVSMDKTVACWDAVTGALKSRFKQRDLMISVAFLPGLSIMVSVCDTGKLRFRNALTGEYVDVEASSERLASLAVSPDGNTIICGYMRGQIEILRLECK